MGEIWFVQEELKDLVKLCEEAVERTRTDDAKFMRRSYMDRLLKLVAQHTITRQSTEM